MVLIKSRPVATPPIATLPELIAALAAKDQAAAAVVQYVTGIAAASGPLVKAPVVFSALGAIWVATPKPGITNPFYVFGAPQTWVPYLGFNWIGAIGPGIGTSDIGFLNLLGFLAAKRHESKRENAIFGLGKVAGVLNTREIEQEGLVNSVIGASEFAGIVNLSKIEQKGLLNLQLGIGGTFGVINFGQVKSKGYSAYLGLGLGLGIFNAGSIALSGKNSLTVGAGLLNGIWNLGQLKTSKERDIVAGISGGIGLVNGLAPVVSTTAKVPGVPSFTQSEINTAGGDDLVYGGGLYNVTSFLTSKAAGVGGPMNIMMSQLGQILKTQCGSCWAFSQMNPLDMPVGAATAKDNLKDACWGIVNFASLNTGSGDDTVFGAGDDIAGDNAANFAITSFPNHFGSGILNAATATILLGEGDDKLRGETWAVGTPLSPERPPAGIVNYGLIEAGDGSDVVSGYSGVCTNAPTNRGIINEGTIRTGNGRDTVDALTGGFSGAGLTDLGLDDDTLIGFGSGRFDGGGGFVLASQKDTLLLGDGSYVCSLSAAVGGFYSLTKGATTMLLQGFELIGAANNPGSAIMFLAGQTYDVVGNAITSSPTPAPG